MLHYLIANEQAERRQLAYEAASLMQGKVLQHLPSPGNRLPCFAHQYFSYLTPFFVLDWYFPVLLCIYFC